MRRQMLLVLLIVCIAAVTAKRCLPGCGPAGERRKTRDPCKPCKRGYYTSPANNCCIKCKGNLNITGTTAICTPKTKDNSTKHSNSTQCATGFLTLPDPATCNKTMCWCPPGSFLQPLAAPGRRMLSTPTVFAEMPMLHSTNGRWLLKKGSDDVGPDDKGGKGGDDDGPDDNGNHNSTSRGNCTTGSKLGDTYWGKGRGQDDPLVPGDDVGKRWQCVPCPDAGQNPAPNTWRGCCTPPAVWNGSGCA